MEINRNDKRPIWQQLLDQAILHITSGQWPAGELLVPTRELAKQLGVSRSTIQIVYEELLSRGYTVTSGRGGTRVSHWKAITVDDAGDCAANGPTPPPLPMLDTAVDQLHDWYRGKEYTDVEIDFSPHEPYLDDHFHRNWRQAYIQSTSSVDLSNWAYGNPYGYLPLREQIQRYLSLERGIHVQTNQILLTSGAQHSLDLIAQSLLQEGDTVCVEDPGFPAAWMTMKYRRMQVVPVPVDEYGLVVEKMAPNTKLTFVTPSHQCATGVIMSEPRRQQLLHKTVQEQSWIIEDDYDSEYRYRGNPLPTLFSKQPQNTLYLMSFSKIIAPAIRISAIIGPAGAIAQIARIQELTYRHLPIMEQLTLAHFMECGHFVRHMRRARNVYRRRHEVLTKAILASGLGERYTLRGAETGLHILLETDKDLDEEALTQLALDHGIRVYPLRPYCLTSKRQGWVLGFAKVEESMIEKGIQRLATFIL